MEKPEVKLIGTNGNAFALLATAHAAWKDADLPEDKWKEIRDEAMSGDYNHLLRVLMENFEVE